MGQSKLFALLCQRIAEGFAVWRKIGRPACGNDMSVGHDRLILPDRTRIFHIVADSRRGSDGDPVQDFGGDQHPACVADLSDRLLVLVHFFNQLKHFIISAKLVRRPAARYEYSVIVLAVQLFKRILGLSRNAIFAGVSFTLIQPGEMDFRPFLANPVNGIP